MSSNHRREGEPVHEIVVPLDGSRPAERAVHVAGAAALETGDSLRLVRVAPPGERGDALTYLHGAAKALLPGSSVGVEVIEASTHHTVAESILAVVGRDTDDSLLCMSTHGRSGVGSLLFGSTAEEALRRTLRPVLLVGHRCAFPWPGTRGGVLLPVDLSGWDDSLLMVMADVVRTSGLEPTLVKVTHPFDVEDAQHPMSGLESAARRLAHLGIETKSIHRFASDIPLTIADVARSEGAALVAMASGVPAGATRVLLGSVTMRTIHEAPCPILVFPSASGRP